MAIDIYDTVLWGKWFDLGIYAINGTIINPFTTLTEYIILSSRMLQAKFNRKWFCISISGQMDSHLAITKLGWLCSICMEQHKILSNSNCAY